MGRPAVPPRLPHVPHPLFWLLCLLPQLLKAAGPGQAPRDQPLWALLEQYCHAVTTLTNLSGSWLGCIQEPEEGASPCFQTRARPAEGVKHIPWLPWLQVSAPGSGEMSPGASSSILAPRAAPAEAAGKEEGWGVLLGSGAAAKVQGDKGAGQQWNPAPNAAQVE
ncbi:Alpha-Fetoprotein [Manis pentadactyla]|nr:Alpha-Fetoprotein [Manis pentadactyla]